MKDFVLHPSFMFRKDFDANRGQWTTVNTEMVVQKICFIKMRGPLKSGAGFIDMIDSFHGKGTRFLVLFAERHLIDRIAIKEKQIRMDTKVVCRSFPKGKILNTDNTPENNGIIEPSDGIMVAAVITDGTGFDQNRPAEPLSHIGSEKGFHFCQGTFR